jgi:hypothetical protein
MMLGTVAFTHLQADTSTTVLTASLFTIGLGHGMIAPPLMAAAFQGLNRSEMPSATTTANILARVGTSVGTATLAVILQIYLRAGLHRSTTLTDAAKTRTPHALSVLTDAFAPHPVVDVRNRRDRTRAHRTDPAPPHRSTDRGVTSHR